jgi:hypothetical protein
MHFIFDAPICWKRGQFHDYCIIVLVAVISSPLEGTPPQGGGGGSGGHHWGHHF